ncbi:hypothetical protein [Nocardia gipuzkoensis]|uniref:hypothetical protein n=1 Tax=Nocardia gipuzkoensis TaxID=2749991 RepID=UPI003EE0B247
MVLHIETGVVTFAGARNRLEELGYRLRPPVGNGPVHRFVRGGEQVDVMVADHLAPSQRPSVSGRAVFAVSAGTSALRKTANCELEIDGAAIRLSVPDVLGAMVLKGAAYKEDSRDRGRHLDDAAILACTVENPVRERMRMEGSDRSRVRVLAEELRSIDHRAWLGVSADARKRGHAALRLMAQDPLSGGRRPGIRTRRH